MILNPYMAGQDEWSLLSCLILSDVILTSTPTWQLRDFCCFKVSDVFKGVTGALHESSKEIRWYNVPMAWLKASSPWYTYSEELKELRNSGSLVYSKSKHKYRMLCSTAATEHTLYCTSNRVKCNRTILRLKHPLVWNVLSKYFIESFLGICNCIYF